MKKLLTLIVLSILLSSCWNNKGSIDTTHLEIIDQNPRPANYEELSKGEKMEIDFNIYKEKQLSEMERNFEEYRERRIKEIEEVIEKAPDDVDRGELNDYREEELDKLDTEYDEMIKFEKERLDSEYEEGVESLKK